VFKKPFILLMLLLTVACNRDVDHAHVTGTVRDTATLKPLPGIALVVVGGYYRGGDYDSYNGYQKVTLITDSKGHFETDFPNLAYLEIRTNRLPKDSLVYAEEIFKKETEVLINLP
jgi:hypothetical protein